MISIYSSTFMLSRDNAICINLDNVSGLIALISWVRLYLRSCMLLGCFDTRYFLNIPTNISQGVKDQETEQATQHPAQCSCHEKHSIVVAQHQFSLAFFSHVFIQVSSCQLTGAIKISITSINYLFRWRISKSEESSERFLCFSIAIVLEDWNILSCDKCKMFSWPDIHCENVYLICV